MSELSVSVSAHPDALGVVSHLADGVEVKLDWEHIDDLLNDQSLTEVCRKQGVNPEWIISIHLPPGTNSRYGMAVAPGNTGTISDFVHGGVGTAVSPDWVTVHTVRKFDYQEHIDRLATITELTGYPIAVENTPDASYYHTPEDLAAMALLTTTIDRLSQTHLLVDTAHVDTDRRAFEIDEDAVDDVLARLDPELATELEGPLRGFLDENLEEAEPTVPASDPWRPVLTTLTAVGGDSVTAVHLNDPVDDGLPRIGHDSTNGLDAVLEYCHDHDITIVLEPGPATKTEIEGVVHWVKKQEE